jgi:AcrR family transcriptional regulator
MTDMSQAPKADTDDQVPGGVDAGDPAALLERLADSEASTAEFSPRQQRILDATATLLVRYGYRKTTVDDVAREAGVGKGTIYLHWKDKNDLFRAAIWRASEQTTQDMLRRMAADPEGGLFHRQWTHGFLAILANPLAAALLVGRQDIFQGLVDSWGPGTATQLAGNAAEHISQLQQSGLIRGDLPVSLITYLIGALEVGIVQVSNVVDARRVPAIEELADALSDLIRRWLEPPNLPSDSEEGKRIMAEWLENTLQIGQRLG